MKVCFILPPSVDDMGAFETKSAFDRHLAESSNLGVLTLAAILDQSGIAVSLIDLSRILFDSRRLRPVPDLAQFAAEQVANLDFDVAGLSTICGTYPLMLRFAGALKRLRPDVPVILGGPQATVVDTATMEAFDAVDLIVRGEADETLPKVLDALSGRGALDFLAGITFRVGRRIVRNPNAPAVLNLDALPLPAYHLLPGVRQARRLDLEAGRGCPFSCTFCSTNDFFRRRFRLKSNSVMIDHMTTLQNRYGLRDFDLIHDMFTVDRRRVAGFCTALLESGHQFRWRCSARTDSVDRELLQLMADAGCASVFFGLESGSKRIQTSIDKGLDIGAARSMIRHAGDLHIAVTAATIIGFPDEEEADLSATLDLLFEAMAQPHVNPQVSVLAPLAGTPIYHQYRDALKFDGTSLDFCQQGYEHTTEDRELIARYRDIFPNFYSVPARFSQGFLLELSLFIIWNLLRCRWIMVAAARVGGGPLQLFRRWLAWRKQPASINSFYPSPGLQRDLLAFYAQFRKDSDAIDTLLTVEEHLCELQEAAPAAAPAGRSFDVTATPVIAREAKLFSVIGDPQAAIRSICDDRPMPPETRSPVLVGARRRGTVVEVHRLSDRFSSALQLCDGSRTCHRIAETLSAEGPSPLPDTDAYAGWLALIEFLRTDNWICLLPAMNVGQNL